MATTRLTIQQAILLPEPLLVRILDDALRQRLGGIIDGQHPVPPQGEVLQSLGLHHALPVIDGQLALEKLDHCLMKVVRGEDAVDQPPLLQLLGGQLAAEHEEVVGTVGAHRVRKGRRGPELGHQSKRAEGDLEVCVFGGQHNVRDALEPGSAPADGGPVERQHEHFLVVDHGA